MSSDRFFLDTVFIQALLNARDQQHKSARDLWPRVRNALKIYVTEAVLMEVANGLSDFRRRETALFIRKLYHTANVPVIGVNASLFQRALDLYQARPDKEWGMTDCISFIVMEDHGLTDAVTADRHFVQAGYRVMLLDNN